MSYIAPLLKLDSAEPLYIYNFFPWRRKIEKYLDSTGKSQGPQGLHNYQKRLVGIWTKLNKLIALLEIGPINEPASDGILTRRNEKKSAE